MSPLSVPLMIVGSKYDLYQVSLEIEIRMSFHFQTVFFVNSFINHG